MQIFAALNLVFMPPVPSEEPAPPASASVCSSSVLTSLISVAFLSLWVLDEPENSLSAQNQLQLKYFIEDCVRNHGCQFIISTHSPFLLSLEHALIYDIDDEPPREKRWTELESVRTYFEFFRDNEWKFDLR